MKKYKLGDIVIVDKTAAYKKEHYQGPEIGPIRTVYKGTLNFDYNISFGSEVGCNISEKYIIGLASPLIQELV